MKITAQDIATYGTTATILNFYFPKEGTCRVKVRLEDGEEKWFFADPKTYFKGFVGKTEKLILNFETLSLVYPNSDTHPVPTTPSLPEHLASICYRPTK